MGAAKKEVGGATAVGACAPMAEIPNKFSRFAGFRSFCHTHSALNCTTICHFQTIRTEKLSKEGLTPPRDSNLLAFYTRKLTAIMSAPLPP